MDFLLNVLKCFSSLLFSLLYVHHSSPTPMHLTALNMLYYSNHYLYQYLCFSCAAYVLEIVYIAPWHPLNTRYCPFIDYMHLLQSLKCSQHPSCLHTTWFICHYILFDYKVSTRFCYSFSINVAIKLIDRTKWMFLLIKLPCFY